MNESEAKIILAFLFKNSGKEELSPPEIYLPLSMNLKWFSPGQAQSFIDLSLKQKLLIKKKDLLSPNFDYREVAIPLGYHPSEQIFLEKKEVITKQEDIIDRIIIKISKKANLDNKEIVKKISIVEKEKNITAEVASLLICKEYDVDATVFYDEIEEKIFKENKG